MRRRRFMRCDRGLRKSILLAFFWRLSRRAPMSGLGYGDWDRETQALDSSGPGAVPLSGNLPDCRRRHKLSARPDRLDEGLRRPRSPAPKLRRSRDQIGIALRPAIARRLSDQFRVTARSRTRPKASHWPIEPLRRNEKGRSFGE